MHSVVTPAVFPDQKKILDIPDFVPLYRLTNCKNCDVFTLTVLGMQVKGSVRGRLSCNAHSCLLLSERRTVHSSPLKWPQILEMSYVAVC